jgi:hypothetical protein
MSILALLFNGVSMFYRKTGEHCDAFSAVKMNSTDEMVAAHFLKLKFGIAKNLSLSPCKAKLEKSCFLVGQHSYICNGFG